MDKYLDELKNKIIAEIDVSNIENIIKENDEILELNELLNQYNKLDDGMKRVYQLGLQVREFKTVNEMTKLFELLPNICVANGIRNEKELGHFVVENELFPVDFNEDVLPFLDYKKVGEYYLKTNLGKIIDGVYVEDTSSQTDWCIENIDETNKQDFSM